MPARWWRSARRGTALRLRCRARRVGQQFIDDVSALAGGVTVEAATHLVGDAADGGSFTPRRRRPEMAPQYRRRLPARRSLAMHSTISRASSPAHLDGQPGFIANGAPHARGGNTASYSTRLAIRPCSMIGRE